MAFEQNHTVQQPRYALNIGDGPTVDVEVALRDSKGSILAVVIRNADGALGRRFVADAGIRLEESNARQTMAMAGPGRTSSLTTGTTTSNDNFKTLYNNEFSDMQMIKWSKNIVHAIENQEKQDKSLIFIQPDADLECTQRVHAFPKKEAGAKAAQVKHMNWGQGMDQYIEYHACDEREGGRMHGHTDQPGTDGVVLLNLGSCDFFLDIGKGPGVGRCKAQKTKECWCIGSGGHWMAAADAPKERYYTEGVSRPLLLRDRLCETCAAGGEGKACPHCTAGTVRLRSGDVVVFSGCHAFHGVSAVMQEEETPPPADAPHLPAWAQTKQFAAALFM